MRFIVGVLLVVALAPSIAAAMDTRAAGRCVALGALSQDYAGKAEAILATSRATGERPLVEQRVHEEFAYLARIKEDKTAKEPLGVCALIGPPRRDNPSP